MRPEELLHYLFIYLLLYRNTYISFTNYV